MKTRSLAAWLLFVLLQLAAVETAAKEATPVASGEYRVLLSGRRIGQESFSVFRSKHYELRIHATLYWPAPHRYEVRYELGPSFEPQRLEIQLTRAGRITKMKLKRRKKGWRSEIEEKGRRKLRRGLGLRRTAEVDFDSPLFSSFILRRLSLHPGEEHTTEAVVFHVSSLTGERTRQTYRRLENVMVETPATGRVGASAYELRSEGRRYQLWADASGVVLLRRVQLPEGKLEHELVRLDAKRGAWQPPRK